ncbi:hypothetical protein Dthio_PD2957 [Desulfonatronospira thiodismutans ASO3-1]|uniref:Uncharacterized protein n=2 Tax=Desulfonatronospira TaxID=488937 RepID=D6SLH2_9BACT|nr:MULTISPECIES: hypothetical protein [Desulfonatronospira]EFI35533.1 hypothetical protein Dthio_PD2957 [Desulfonatronospira thiodismutans ASO3-1]RQD72798.1 MAG: hypothetical protein D5S03_14090 [Desulfonatronospira sp. MSAO_Bac3]
MHDYLLFYNKIWPGKSNVVLLVLVFSCLVFPQKIHGDWNDPLQGLPQVMEFGAYLPDPDEEQEAVVTQIWVRTSASGHLQLLDSAKRPVAGDESSSPVVFFQVFQDPDHAEDQAFFVQFVPQGNKLGTRRLIRVHPGENIYISLDRGLADQSWTLNRVRMQDFGLQAQELESVVSVDSVFDEEALTQELEELLRVSTVHPGEDPAGKVHEQLGQTEDSAAAGMFSKGMDFMGRGEYSRALEYFEQSQEMEPTPELADRIRRLRSYIELQQ